MWFKYIAISINVLTKIAGAVIALNCSPSFAFLLAQGYRVLQGCGHTHTHTKKSISVVLPASDASK